MVYVAKVRTSKLFYYVVKTQEDNSLGYWHIKETCEWSALSMARRYGEPITIEQEFSSIKKAVKHILDIE